MRFNYHLRLALLWLVVTFGFDYEPGSRFSPSFEVRFALRNCIKPGRSLFHCELFSGSRRQRAYIFNLSLFRIRIPTLKDYEKYHR